MPILGAFGVWFMWWNSERREAAQRLGVPFRCCCCGERIFYDATDYDYCLRCGLLYNVWPF